MNPPVPSPDDPGLRTLLQQAHPDPPLPSRFQEEVWRRVERAACERAPRPMLWMREWIQMWLRPAPLAAAIAAAVLFGTWMGFRHGEERLRLVERTRYVASVDPLLRGHR